MRRLVTTLLAVVLGLTGLTACGGDAAGGSGKGELKIAIYPGAYQSLPAYLAQELGIFEKHGVDASLINVQGGPAAVSALLSRSADVMLNGLDNVTLARESSGGPDLVAVSGNTSKQINSLIVRADLDTPSADLGYPDAMRDLKGKRIGVPARGSSLENIMRIMLEEGGLDPDSDVDWVALGTGQALAAAISSGQVDAILTPEPLLTQLVDIQKEARMLLETREGQPESLQWPYNQWWSVSDVVEKKQDTFDDFQAAMKETFEYMAAPENLESMIPHVQEFLATDEKSARALMTPLNISTFGFEIDQAGVERLWDHMQSLGLLEESPSFDDVVDAGSR